MPRTEALRRAEEEVRALCAALRPTASGAEAYSAAAAVAARDGNVQAAAALAAAAQAAAAAVGTSAGGGLRAAALEGLCFFAWTHVRPDGGGSSRNGIDADSAAFLENEAGSIPKQLAIECAKMAAAAAPKPLPSSLQIGDGNDNGNNNNAMMMSEDGMPLTAEPPPPPAEFEIPSTDLLRSADVLGGAGGVSPAGVGALPPLGRA